MSLVKIISQLSKASGVGNAPPPPPAPIVPTKTNLGIDTTAYPMYVRSVDNLAEIGKADNVQQLATLLNGDAGWSASGTWGYSGADLTCTGTPPAKVIAYNRAGNLYAQNLATDWQIGTLGTCAQEGAGVRITTPNDLAAYYFNNLSAPRTFISALEYSFKLTLTSGKLYQALMLLEGNFNIQCNFSGGISDGETGGSTVITNTTSWAAGVYYASLKVLRNKIIWTLTGGGGQIVSELVRTPAREGGGGAVFKLAFTEVNCLIEDFKIDVIGYKNADYVAVGDSVTWGRSANTLAGSWYGQVSVGFANELYAHGDRGFDNWIESVAELQLIQPVNVFVMGSYVNTGAGLTTFQTKYSNFISLLAAIPSIQKIYHLGSFPNNFGTDIRPFNSWKSSTYNSGIHQFFNGYYAALEEGNGAGYDLKDIYDGGGSHLTQAGQDIVANEILNNLI